MTKEKQNTKLISRKVVLSWKKATESENVSWSEIFPIICALYELDNNFQNDNSFKRLNVEKSLFYTKFQKTLESLNLSHYNIHYFRKLTKHLLKTFIEANKEINKLQNDGTEDNEYHTIKKIEGQEVKVITKSKRKYEVTANDIIIPSIIIDEIVNFYIKLKKADTFESNNPKAKENDEVNQRRRSVNTVKIPASNIKEIKTTEIRGTRRPLPPLPKSPKYSPNFSIKHSPKFTPLIPPSVSPALAAAISPPLMYSDGRKFTPPANASVIKIPKKSQLRKIKRKSLIVNGNYNMEPEENIISPCESYTSPISPSRQYVVGIEDVQSTTSSSHSPHLVHAPTRNASLKPTQKRISLNRKVVPYSMSRNEDNRYPSPSSSYASSKHYSSVLSPSTKSFILSPSSRSNSISPLPSYSEVSAPPEIGERENTFVTRNGKTYRKVKSMYCYRRSSNILPGEDSLPVIPPITPTYTEEIAPTVSKFSTTTEDAIFPLPPVNESDNLELVSVSPCFSHHSPSFPINGNNTIFLNSHRMQKKKTVNEDEDLSEIFDKYGDDDQVAQNTRPHSELSSSYSSSKRNSIFKNNGLTPEGLKYSRNSMNNINPVDAIMFKDGSEGVDREVEMVHHFKELMQMGEMKGHSVFGVGNVKPSEQQQQQEDDVDDIVSTVITDAGVIDGLEEDLLNHKTSQRRKSVSSVTSKRSSVNSKRTSMSSKRSSLKDIEKTKKVIVNEKKDEDKTDNSPKDQDNKNQFRLSLLTSKSSIHTLERKIKEDSEKVNEDDESNKKATTSEEDEKKEEKQYKNEGNTGKSPSTSPVEERAFPVFVHPIQLYNIMKMINTYKIGRLPHCAHPVTEQWISSSNEIAKKLWDQLQGKEDVISQIIIYATFYDHVKGTAFPLHDPEHVFLKELVSSASSVEDLKEFPTSPSHRNKRYSFLGKDKETLQQYENQLFNKNLILEIKKELLI